MEWTVQKLIDELQKVNDKSRNVRLAVNDIVRRNFHINDHIAPVLYLTNRDEEGYRPKEISNIKTVQQIIEEYEKLLAERKEETERLEHLWNVKQMSINEMGNLPEINDRINKFLAKEMHE